MRETTGLLIGLDVGTTSSKAVAFTTDGRAVGEGRAPMPWVLHPHGAEVDARALVASAYDALARVLEAAPPGRVLALGVASMGESGVLLDAHGAPLTPVIAWHDTRDAAEVDDLAATFGATHYARRTGLPLRSQWSLTKHRWLMTHDADARRAVRRLNVAEWVVRALGGEESAEQSLASRTGWLELGTRGWWDDALAWSAAGRSLLPPLVTAGTPLGPVTADDAPAPLAGAVLTVAGHDHQAATVGAGAYQPGDELDSCGTAEALVRTVPAGLDPTAVETLAAAGITTGWHVLACRWSLLAAANGGLALQRILGMLGATVDDVAGLDAAALEREISAVTVSGVDDEALSVSGVANGTTPADLWRAALDAVTARSAAIHTAMSVVVGGHRSLVVTGGWSRSAALLEVKRRAIGPLQTVAVPEAGARGAALLAGLAAGVYAGSDDFPALATAPSPVDELVLAEEYASS